MILLWEALDRMTGVRSRSLSGDKWYIFIEGTVDKISVSHGGTSKEWWGTVALVVAETHHHPSKSCSIQPMVFDSKECVCRRANGKYPPHHEHETWPLFSMTLVSRRPYVPVIWWWWKPPLKVNVGKVKLESFQLKQKLSFRSDLECDILGFS